MPRSQKPRRKYKPNKLQSVCDKPRLDSVYLLFEPIYSLFDQLQSGEIESINEKYVFNLNGRWCEIAPAIIGWADLWERIGRNENIHFDGSPLRRLANKLSYHIPLTEEELVIGLEKVEETRRMFVSLPVSKIQSHAQTEQISIELERLKLKEAA